MLVRPAPGSTLEAKRDQYLVRLTYHFGLMPWDIDRLLVSHFHAYCAAVDKLDREARRG